MSRDLFMLATIPPPFLANIDGYLHETTGVNQTCMKGGLKVTEVTGYRIIPKLIRAHYEHLSVGTGLP
jgi:hypothetical protein